MTRADLIAARRRLLAGLDEIRLRRAGQPTWRDRVNDKLAANWRRALLTSESDER